MTKDQKRLLTEKLLKECDHPRDLIREYMGGIFCYNCNHIVKIRTFLTWQDLGDVKEALVREELQDRFWKYAWDQWPTLKEPTHDSSFSFDDWLFRPTDENGEAHFCKLVAEFMEKN